MSLSPAFLDELRARTLLSTLIGRTIKVTKAGREYKACCPFHNEKTPSFTINDEKGFYHCFGCSAHGDAIRWMTDQRGLPFMDAVKELAAAAGMEVPAADPRAAEKAERGNALFDVMTAAADWFAEQLAGADGVNARSYLKNRGLSAATVKTFGMGYAPDSRGQLKAALSRFGDEKLIEAGLLISVEDKEPYDRFRGRLMIPIRDVRGRVIAFGGRILGVGEPKYLNSPDTPLFDKGRTLYNLDRAGPDSRKTNRVIVVEGYMDVIALAQAGIGDVVAPLGTALTEHQLERLWRLTDAPTLCFDGDSAGQKASVRAISRAMPALGPSRSLKFLTLPVGQDPDDLIKAGGKRAMDMLLEKPEHLVDRLWRHELNAEPLTTPEARAGLKRRLNEHVQVIGDGDVRSQYQAEFRTRFDTAFLSQPPRRTFMPNGRSFSGGYRAPEAPPSGRTKTISGAGIEPMIARALLAGLIRYPALLHSCGDALSAINVDDPALEKMRMTLLDAAYDHAELDSDALLPICESAGLEVLLGELRGNDVAKRLAFSFLRRNAEPDDAQRALKYAIDIVSARPALVAELQAATARMNETMDEASFAYQVEVSKALRVNELKLAALANGEDPDEIDGEVR